MSIREEIKKTLVSFFEHTSYLNVDGRQAEASVTKCYVDSQFQLLEYEWKYRANDRQRGRERERENIREGNLFY